MSNFAPVIEKNGVGLGALYITSLLITGYYLDFFSLRRSFIVGVIALVPPFVVWAVSKQFNKKLVRLLATEKVAEVFVRIKFHQGSKRFFNEYDDEIQEGLNDLDEKFHNQVVNFLSGAVITVALVMFAVVELPELGYLGAAGLLAVSAATAYVLGVASFRKMNELLEYSVQVSKVTNEA